MNTFSCVDNYFHLYCYKVPSGLPSFVPLLLCCVIIFINHHPNLFLAQAFLPHSDALRDVRRLPRIAASQRIKTERTIKIKKKKNKNRDKKKLTNE